MFVQNDNQLTGAMPGSEQQHCIVGVHVSVTNFSSWL